MVRTGIVAMKRGAKSVAVPANGNSAALANDHGVSYSV
jgi:hypothetical protein